MTQVAPAPAGKENQAAGDYDYGIYIHNSSDQNDLSAIVYQSDPGMPSNAKALAWWTKPCHMNTNADLKWNITYNFVWGENGKLDPGAFYDAGEVVTANPTDKNTITLAYPGGGFEFQDWRKQGESGTLYIHEANDVPSGKGCVGIGMQGAGTFVFPTHSTGTGYINFNPHPNYWIAFGSFQAGRVVDKGSFYFPKQLTFEHGNNYAVCDYTGEGDDNGWKISYQSTPPR
jgi:rhizosphere induced protein